MKYIHTRVAKLTKEKVIHMLDVGAQSVLRLCALLWKPNASSVNNLVPLILCVIYTRKNQYRF